MLAKIEDLFRERLGLRIGPEMAAYLLRRLDGVGVVPLMGRDARTGLPLRRELPAELIREALGGSLPAPVAVNAAGRRTDA